jgi:2-polyprenyl-3-methyl-5-hydroxy-6-metoxy-1,4-benzoquinol methylase
MVDFDYQWKNLMTSDALANDPTKFECNDKRVKEFLKMTGIKPWYKKDSFVKEKICLDAGCGPGRWTCAMQRLGARKVDSFDISPEAVELCKKINPSAYVFNIFDLEPNPTYDFVLSWGVLHHTPDTRKAFAKVASQVKKNGMLHVMIYNKENDWAYDGFRGKTCVEKHKEWIVLSMEEKITLCKKKVEQYGGDIHGWFDAFNPEYNWSHSEEEVRNWFVAEGFTNIRNKMIKQNINMNGIKE